MLGFCLRNFVRNLKKTPNIGVGCLKLADFISQDPWSFSCSHLAEFLDQAHGALTQ